MDPSASLLPLMRQAVHGDREAADRLFARAADRLLLFIQLRLGGKLRARLEAADVLQEVFTHAHRDPGRFDPEATQVPDRSFLQWPRWAALNCPHRACRTTTNCSARWGAVAWGWTTAPTSVRSAAMWPSRYCTAPLGCRNWPWLLVVWGLTLTPLALRAASRPPPMLLRPALVALVLLAASPTQTQVADTQFSARRGLYTNPLVVTVSTATPGATIRYTLDCSDPRIAPNFVQGPSPLVVAIDPTSTNGGLRPLTSAVVLRADAFAPGMAPTCVDTQTYGFPARVLSQQRPAGFTTAVQFDVAPNIVHSPLYSGRILGDLAALPSMSVVGDATQIFGSSRLLRAANGSIEVPGSIEVMHPDGRRDQVDCGFTPRSWTQNKRSIRAYFRSQYGADKWRHDLFRNAPQGGVVLGTGVQLTQGVCTGVCR